MQEEAESGAHLSALQDRIGLLEAELQACQDAHEEELQMRQAAHLEELQSVQEIYDAEVHS